MMVRPTLEHGEQAAGEISARELLRDLGAIALGDAGDERLFGGEIAVEIARAHAGFGANLLHGGAVKARAHKAALRRSQNLGATVRLKLGVSPAHDRDPPTPYCSAVKPNERSLI